jgi:hypothetical protein
MHTRLDFVGDISQRSTRVGWGLANLRLSSSCQQKHSSLLLTSVNLMGKYLTLREVNVSIKDRQMDSSRLKRNIDLHRNRKFGAHTFRKMALCRMTLRMTNLVNDSQFKMTANN